MIKNVSDENKKLWLNVSVFLFLFCGVLVNLINTHAVHSFGFPLDDAWIHQTYARNLAQYGEWAFIRGITSGGSTAPLWTLLLVPGYLFGDFYYAWTVGLGVISLFLTAIFCMKIAAKQFSNNVLAILLSGLVVVLEWHLLWAALSGMETIFYVLLLAIVFWELIRDEQKRWVFIGILLGLIVWIRPDGITVIGPCLWMMFFVKNRKQDSWKNLLKFLAPLVLFLLAYLIFNLLISGSIWPATFYAKQAEYVSMLQIPFLKRVGSLFILPLTGGGILLLPRFFLCDLGRIEEEKIALHCLVPLVVGFQSNICHAFAGNVSAWAVSDTFNIHICYSGFIRKLRIFFTAVFERKNSSPFTHRLGFCVCHHCDHVCVFRSAAVWYGCGDHSNRNGANGELAG